MDDPKLTTDGDDILLNVWNKEDDNDVFSIDLDLLSQEIQKHAHYKWEDAERPHGRCLDFCWCNAEKEIHAVLGLYLPTIPAVCSFLHNHYFLAVLFRIAVTQFALASTALPPRLESDPTGEGASELFCCVLLEVWWNHQPFFTQTATDHP